MISYPYTSQISGYHDDGRPIYDRASNSEQQRELNKKIYSPGVDVRDASALKVIAGDGMSVVVQPGMGMSPAGAMFFEPKPRTLLVQAAESQDRIDIVVSRDDQSTNVRCTDLYVVKGVAAQTPIAPELTQNSTISEMELAEIFVAKNTSTITNQRITDTRLNTDVCGVFATAWPEVDTKPYFDQIQAIADEESAAWQVKFNAWFGRMKDQLSTDAAGNLQQQINERAIVIDDTATLPASGWSDTAPYTQTVDAPRMAALYEPIVDIVLTGAAEDKAAQLEAWSAVSEIETGEGTITAMCLEDRPECNIQIRLKAVT